MILSEKQLSTWFVAALALLVCGVALAASGLPFASTAGLIFRAIFGFVTASVVIGFYAVMLLEGIRKEVGVYRASLIAFFLVIPIASAFLYYFWTRRKRSQRSD